MPSSPRRERHGSLRWNNLSTKGQHSSMPARSLAPMLTLWASSYLGCALFLLASLLPQGSVSIELLGQLAWIALIGSIPSALVLGTASRVAGAPRSVIAASTVAVVTLTVAIGWEHADFLLSGPHWMLHPQRQAARQRG